LLASYLPLFLAIPLAIFLLTAPGFVTYNLILQSEKNNGQNNLSLAEHIFWTIALSLMLDSWVGLVLASFGLFSAGTLLAVMAVWVLGGGIGLWRLGYKLPRLGRISFNRENLTGWLLILLIAGTTVLFYLAQHETVVGAQDSGVYYNSGVSIARTGSLIIDDPLLPTIGKQDSRNYPLLLQGMPGGVGRFLFVDFQRLPGYYVMDNLEGLNTGKVIPQFFHLYPTTLAIGYSLFGPYGELAVTPFLGILAVFAVYLTTRRLFPGKRGEWIALVAGLLLALNGVQVWFARQTLWEILGEFLTFTGLYAFIMMVKPKEGVETNAPTVDSGNGIGALCGFGAGVSFGLLGLAHASQAPIMLGLIVPYLLWMRLTRRWAAPQWWFAGPFGLLILHLVLHIRIFSLAYWEGIFHNLIITYRQVLYLLIPAAVVGFLIILIIDAMPGRVRAVESWLGKRWLWISAGLAGIVAFYFIYNYFFRIFYVGTDGRSRPFEYLLSWQSYIGAPTSLGPERNLLRLGWYFSPLGILLAILGVAAMLARKLNARTALFLALSLIVSYTFIDENYTQEGYIYSLRRYVNVTVPAFTIFIAYALLAVLPDLAKWAEVWFSRWFGRKVVYAQAAGANSANIAFAVTQTSVENPPPTESNVGVLLATPSPNHSRGYKIGLGLGLILTAVMCLFLVWTNRTIYTLAEYGPGLNAPGMVKQMENLAGKFGPKDIIIFSGDRDTDGKPATTLTYMFNRPAFVLTQAPKPDELALILTDWEKQGYTIKAMLGPDGGRFAPTGYELKLEDEFTLNFRQFESLPTQKPYNIQENELTYGLYTVQKQQSGGYGGGQGTINSPQGWSIQIGKQDYAAMVRGFYGLEFEKDNSPYRWTGQQGVLRVPCFDTSRPTRLQITLDPGVNRPAQLGPLTLSISLGNDIWQPMTPLNSLTIQPGPQTYTLDLAANGPASKVSCKTGASSLILGLDVNKTWQPAKFGLGNDQRDLGIKLLKVKLSQ